MRRLSLIPALGLALVLGLGFVLAGFSLAGSADRDLPGVGTFAYSGSPTAATTHQPMIVAGRF